LSLVVETRAFIMMICLGIWIWW